MSILGVQAAVPPLGRQDLRGLPFELAEDKDRCYIRPSDGPVRVEVNQPATYVVVAHRQLPEKTPTIAEGETLAVYKFQLNINAPPVSVPIRQRFEIQTLGAAARPFLTVPDRNDRLLPRTEGRFDQMGHRQFEAHVAQPNHYYLWAWRNPSPEVPLSWIEFERSDLTLIGGVTVSTFDETPFVRAGRQPLVIDLQPADPTAVVRADDVTVELDRGVATYVQQIPGPASRKDTPAWGRESISHTHLYCEVAALPSATVVMAHQGKELVRSTWGALLEGRAVEGGRARLRVVEPDRNWIHVTVADRDTGRPVPCRVHFQSPDGVPFQPHGHHNHVNSNLGTWHIDIGGDVRLGDLTYAYIDGTCQGWLPRGEVQVEVARGFEYRPVQKTVHITPDQRELRIEIARWADMGQSGWYSGDSHVHFLSTPGSHLEQQGEDLRVVNLLQTQCGSLFTNTEDFTGKVSATDDGRYLTYVGQENRQHMMGHLTLWGLKTPIMPFSSGGPSEAELGGTMESTLADWADRAHRQGATVVIPHFPYPNGEPAVLVATHRADAIELLLWESEFERMYYGCLNAGYRLPIVGGTDKMTSGVPVGLNRTYARIDGVFTYEAWCSAVRNGKTFLSGGPLLQLRVDGHDIGDSLQLRGPGTVHVEARADSIFALDSLELVVNGRTCASANAGGTTPQPDGAPYSLSIDTPISITKDSWIAARCHGITAHVDEWQLPTRAHTSPVYVSTSGDAWKPRDPKTAHYLLTLIEGGLEYVRQIAPSYPAGHVTHPHGEQDHHRYLERPFEQAIDAIHAEYPALKSVTPRRDR